MSERSELRRRREERMENGVKNLKGARLFPKTFSNHGFRDVSLLGCLPLEELFMTWQPFLPGEICRFSELPEQY
jgi:hypothetical protein